MDSFEMGYKFLIKDISAPNCRFNETFTALLLCRARLGSQGGLTQWDLGLGCALSPPHIPERCWGSSAPSGAEETPWNIFHPLGLPRLEAPGPESTQAHLCRFGVHVPSCWGSGDRGQHSQACARCGLHASPVLFPLHLKANSGLGLSWGEGREIQPENQPLLVPGAHKSRAPGQGEAR